jgi:hypothetical protein
MECRVVFEPSQPDRFYMDMKVYRVMKTRSLGLTPAQPSEVWRGIYLAVEMKPWQDTGRQIKAS